MEKFRNMKRGCISNIKKFKWEIVKIFEVVDSCFMPVFVCAWVFRCGCVSVCVCMCVGWVAFYMKYALWHSSSRSSRHNTKTVLTRFHTILQGGKEYWTLNKKVPTLSYSLDESLSFNLHMVFFLSLFGMNITVQPHFIQGWQNS